MPRVVIRRQLYAASRGQSYSCLLKPVAVYPDPDRANAYLVMTEVMNADGTPHPSNGRATIDDDDSDFWFGFEQEYFIMDTETQITFRLSFRRLSWPSRPLLLLRWCPECLRPRRNRRPHGPVP